MKSRNDHKMEIEATEYFNTLLQIYENLPDKDYSIISSTTNLFSESFASMIGKFKKAGVDFKNILPKKCIVPEEDYQGFIELPEKDRITPLPPERWTIYNPYQPYIPFIPEEEQPKVYYPEEEEKEDNDEYNDSDDDDKVTKGKVDGFSSSENELNTDNSKDDDKVAKGTVEGFTSSEYELTPGSSKDDYDQPI